MKLFAVLPLAILLVLIPSASASLVSLGYISFNTDSPAPGQNSFSLNNLSGQTEGCTVDFPICDNLAILTANLQLTYLDDHGSSFTLNRSLASAALPGVTNPSNFIFDATTVNVVSAELTGTAGPLSFLLLGGSTFTALPTFDAVVDFQNGGIGLINLTSSQVTSIPEPGSFSLGLTAAILLIGVAARRRP